MEIIATYLLKLSICRDYRLTECLKVWITGDFDLEELKSIYR